MPLKRFLVFTYANYYPGGGWTDFRGSFDTIREAALFLVEYHDDSDNLDIVDLQTGAVIHTDEEIAAALKE